MELFERLRASQRTAAFGEEPAVHEHRAGGPGVEHLRHLERRLGQNRLPEVPVIVDASCTGSGDAKLHEAALDIMEGLQIQVINR